MESNVYVQEIVFNLRDDLYPSTENDGPPSRLPGYFSASLAVLWDMFCELEDFSHSQL